MGLFVERVRWNEAAFTRQYIPFLFREDVTLRAGIRGETTWRDRSVHIELSGGRRLDYLFQNGTGIPGLNTTDVTVTELKVSINPFASRAQSGNQANSAGRLRADSCGLRELRRRRASASRAGSTSSDECG